MIQEVILGLASQPLLLLTMLVLCGISAGFFIAWRSKSKVWLLHAHLASFLGSIFLLAYSLNCSLSVFQGLLAFCATVLTKVLLVVLPISVVTVFLLGYYFLPWFVRKSLRARSTNLFAKFLPSNVAVWIIDSAKPHAFSTQKHIFLSVGILELLSKKEAQAVILHELSHIQQNNSWTKLTSHLARWISPLSYFSVISNTCEQEADAYAAKVQGTWKFVLSARRKVREF
ncbi:MAG: M48 family metalloprotease [Candidatus Woesearchaeota archaeon]|nr:M48 family metalloprotease [Candidatus Woesearchaeota archaeon]